MDYEEKYEKALERAKEYYEAYEGKAMMAHVRGALECIFPELKKESEDERIRKDIIQHFAKGIEGSSFDEVREKYKIWIAWLEKQYEHVLAKKHLLRVLNG